MDGDLSSLRTEVLHRQGERLVTAVMAGRPLREALAEMLLALEREAQDVMIGSVLLLQDGKLYLGAAPSLPDDYSEAIDGEAIGPAAGSCGTAAYYGEPVFVDDIKTDPLWMDYRDVALSHGLRACWSMPIRNPKGQVLGAFANYYREVRHPRVADFHAIELMAVYVATAIEQARMRGQV